ncbi:hypothetical protein BJX64DRAFT_202187 [Aspergillus heterothallicus]
MAKSDNECEESMIGQIGLVVGCKPEMLWIETAIHRWVLRTIQSWFFVELNLLLTRLQLEPECSNYGKPGENISTCLPRNRSIIAKANKQLTQKARFSRDCILLESPKYAAASHRNAFCKAMYLLLPSVTVTSASCIVSASSVLSTGPSTTSLNEWVVLNSQHDRARAELRGWN